MQADSFRLNIHDCACAAECRATAAPLLRGVLSAAVQISRLRRWKKPVYDEHCRT